MTHHDIKTFGPFSLHAGEAGVHIAVFEVPNEPQNMLRGAYLDDANAMLDYVEQDQSIMGLVIESSKPESFIAGADVGMLSLCETAEDATALAKAGQALFSRLEASRIPVVAAIRGACLGGGLELALSCHGRIAADTEKTVLGLPEIRLGLLPGSGGTQRLPRLIGVQDALQLMLTGRRLSSRSALKMGVVDEVVPETILRNVAVERAIELGKSKRGRISRSVSERLLEGNALGRSLLFSQARKAARKKSGGHYPAPDAIIDCVEIGLTEGVEEGLRAEATRFGELAMTSQAQALMWLFLASNELKSESGVSPNVSPRPVTRVGILGAGLMGAGIAYVTAVKAGLDVRLKDRDYDGLAGGLAYLSKRIDTLTKRRRLSEYDRNRNMDRVTPTIDYTGFERADVVIEAVFEDLQLKRRMVAEVEDACSANVIFATNTSSIPVHSIASKALRPENIVGMHYFSPVEKMPLLEVVAADGTSETAIATAVDLGKRQGKTVIVVKDGPGFYVNRILAPYLNEAAQLLLEGVSIESIDEAMRSFGFPLGPFELMDEVGLDVGSKVVPVLESAYGERMRSVGVVEKMVEEGRYGKKSKRGFYKYSKSGNREKPDPVVNTLLRIEEQKWLRPQEIQNRCVLHMIQEAMRCLTDSTIRSTRDGDVGAVFGIGFPPFFGGPFRYVDVVGASALVARLWALSADVGERYSPVGLLQEISESGTRFYQ